MDDIVTRLHRTKFMQHADIEALCDEAAAEIERLGGLLESVYRLAVGHGPNWNVFESWEEAINAYEEARRG